MLARRFDFRLNVFDIANARYCSRLHSLKNVSEQVTSEAVHNVLSSEQRPSQWTVTIVKL